MINNNFENIAIGIGGGGTGGAGGGIVSSTPTETLNFSQAEYGGSPSVNLANGRLKFAFADLSVGYGNYAAGISHLYLSRQNAKFADKIKGFGNGFKLNLTQRVLKDGLVYLYLDADGEIHRFVNYDTNKYYDDRNAKTVLTVKHDGFTLSDGVGNRLIFDTEGLLVKSVACHSVDMVKVYEYAKGRLARVYDQRTVKNGKAKNRIELEYNARGNLSAVVTYVNFNVKQFGLLYGYDQSGNLTSVSKVAYNKSAETVLTREVLRFSYDTSNRLCLIIDAQSKQATQILYSQGRVSKLSRGFIKDTCISLGASDAESKSAANCGTTVLGELSQTEFVSKSHQAFTYGFLSDDNVAYRAEITNENGITLAYFIDRNACITASFENCLTKLKTLSKQGAKRTGELYGSSSFINGNTGCVLVGERSILRTSFSIARNRAEQTLKEFGYSFWLKLSKYYDVAEAQLTYKFKHGNTEISKVYIDGQAQNAWQRVTIPLTAPQNTDDEQSVSPLETLKIKLITNKDVCLDEYEVNEIGFAPMPRAEFMLAGHYAVDVPFAKAGKVGVTYMDVNYNTKTMQTSMGKDFYFTENDVIASYTNEHAHAYYQTGKKLFDVICNNGTKRICNAESLLFSDVRGGWSASSDIPFASKTVSPEGLTVTTTEYEYLSDGFLVRAIGEREDKRSVAVTKIDYKGKTLYETDEYGVTTEYSHNDYGDVTNVRVLASDGTVGMTESYYYDEGRPTKAGNKFGGEKAEYDYFDQAGKVTETDGAGNETSHSVSTEYGVYRNRVRSVAEYDGSEKIGENTVTYENGSIRTVTDGTAKYGIKRDIANDTVEYTQFGAYDEEQTVQRDTVEKIGGLVKHRSDYDQTDYETGYSEANVDLYGKTLMISKGTDNVEEEEVYFHYPDKETTAESRLAVKPESIENRTKNAVTTYSYDADGSLTGWKEKLNGEQQFEVQQIEANAARYKFGNEETEYCTSIVTEDDKILSPRVTSVQNKWNLGSETLHKFYERQKFMEDYSYDKFGRMTEKRNGMNSSYTYEYGANSLVKKIQYKNETIMDNTYGGGIKTQLYKNEEMEYYENGTLKGITENYRWKFPKSKYDWFDCYEISGQTKKQYEYDSARRITKETFIRTKDGVENKTVKEYKYLNNGRIDSVTTNVWNTSNGVIRHPVIDNVQKYTYDAYGRLNYIGAITFYHDRYGNRTSESHLGEGVSYEYKYGGTLVKVRKDGITSTYEYNSDNVRNKKTVNGIETRYYLDGNKILGERGKYDINYYYGKDGLMGFERDGKEYAYILDSQGNVSMVYTVSSPREFARYEYDALGNCTVYDANGKRDTDPNSIGNINPFRWKSFYYDVESNLYYANGSYYDPEKGLYVDASPVYTIEDNAYSVHGLDRNRPICNNVLELACNPSTAFNQTELSIDLAYYEIAEVPLKWWQKPFKWLADLFNGIPVEAKVILGTLFILASVALAFFSGGGSLVGEAMLGANAAALASAAQVGLIELTIGIGFSVAGWAISSAMNNSWNFDELTSSVIDSYFLTGVTFFISSSTNYLKFLSRIKPVTTVELKSNVNNKTAVIGKMDDLNAYKLQPGEFKVADLLPNKGSVRANWKQNSGVLRKIMRSGNPIRDVSVLEGQLVKNTGFLAMERNLLLNHGWKFSEGFWILRG